MSKGELTKEQKISEIMKMLGVLDDHHEHIRESLDMLSDEAIHRQHVHCVAVKAFIDQENVQEDVEPDNDG